MVECYLTCSCRNASPEDPGVDERRIVVVSGTLYYGTPLCRARAIFFAGPRSRSSFIILGNNSTSHNRESAVHVINSCRRQAKYTLLDA